MIPLLALDAPVVPGKSLGGCELGRNIGEHERLLGHASLSGPKQPTMKISYFQARSTFGQVFDSQEEIDAWIERVESDVPPPVEAPAGEPAVELTVDIRDGMIVGLAALGGYSGVLLDSIRTGMTYAEAASHVEISWSYDVFGRVIAGHDGVWLRFEGDDYGSKGDDYVWPAEELAGSNLDAIRIFVPERTQDGSVPLCL